MHTSFKNMRGVSSTFLAVMRLILGSRLSTKDIKRKLSLTTLDTDNMWKMSNITASKADRDKLLVNGIFNFRQCAN